MNASHFGSSNFNDDPSQIGTSPYPLLPDPRYTGVNQAYAEYAGDVRLQDEAWPPGRAPRQPATG